MAKITTDKRIRGTVWNTTYRATTGNKEFSGNVSILDKEMVETGAKFDNTRRNNLEFKAAAASAKLLRDILEGVPPFHIDNKEYPRMLGIMIKMLREDTTNNWGERIPLNGDFSHLDNFDYNKKAPLSSVMEAAHSTVVDRVAGTLTNNIPSFTPILGLVKPEGLSSSAVLYFRFIALGAEVDFTANTVNTDLQFTAYLPYDANATALINQVQTLTAGSTLPWFGILGIDWALQVSGNYIPLRNIASNAL